MVDQMMTQAAGLGTHDRLTLEDQLGTSMIREFRVEIAPTSEAIGIGGSPKDVETLMQMLYLQFTAPKLDTTALDIWKQTGSPGGVSIDDQLNAMLSNGNPRLIPPAATLMALADTGRAMAVFRDRFGNAGDFTFIIVGAATSAQLRPLVERYIASLPTTGKTEKPTDLDVRPWERMLQVTQRVFDVPKASTGLLFDGEFPTSPQEYLTGLRQLDALAWTLRLKFTDDLREQMGGTYGVGVQAWTLSVPEEHYRFGINFDAAPERMSGMLDTMFTILDTVRASGATADELTKIAAMQRRNRETELQDDHYWLRSIELFDRLKIPLAWIVAQPTGRMNAEGIAATARKYLPTDAYIHLTLMPQDSTSYTVVDSTMLAPNDSANSTPHARSSMH
jgi:zinc protease